MISGARGKSLQGKGLHNILPVSANQKYTFRTVWQGKHLSVNKWYKWLDIFYGLTVSQNSLNILKKGIPFPIHVWLITPRKPRQAYFSKYFEEFPPKMHHLKNRTLFKPKGVNAIHWSKLNKTFLTSSYLVCSWLELAVFCLCSRRKPILSKRMRLYALFWSSPLGVWRSVHQFV